MGYVQSAIVLPNSAYWKKNRSFTFKPKTIKKIRKTHLAINSQSIVFGEKPSSILVNGGSFILGGISTTSLRFGGSSDRISVDSGSLVLNFGTSVAMGAGHDTILISPEQQTSYSYGLLVTSSYGGRQGSILDLGDGDDVLMVMAGSSSQAIHVDGVLQTGAGHDAITGEASYRSDLGAGIWGINTGIFIYDEQSVLDTGSGDDTITGYGARGFMIGINAQLTTGDGQDVIQGDPITMYSGRILTGTGDDRIDAPLQLTVTSGGNLSVIDMGAGDDRLRLASRNYTITGSSGDFRVYNTSNPGSILDVRLVGVEWIAGPDGDAWVPLAAGTLSL